MRVGDEQARVAAGEAVVWPPDVVHSAWTEHTPMRAIVVEFAVNHTELEPILIAEPSPDPSPMPGAGSEEPAGPSLEPGAGSGLAAGAAIPLPSAGPDRRARAESADQEPW